LARNLRAESGEFLHGLRRCGDARFVRAPLLQDGNSHESPVLAWATRRTPSQAARSGEEIGEDQESEQDRADAAGGRIPKELERLLIFADVLLAADVRLLFGDGHIESLELRQIGWERTIPIRIPCAMGGARRICARRA